MRRRKASIVAESPSSAIQQDKKDEVEKKGQTDQIVEKKRKNWRCLDSCCWVFGNCMFVYFVVSTAYHLIPRSSLQQIQEAIGDALGNPPAEPPPGLKLAQMGLTVKHPVVFVPGIVTGGLELWEGMPCADDLFRRRLWGGNFGEMYKRPFCWLEHMLLDNVTGLDPPHIRVRPVNGLVAADYFVPGYSVWAVLIEQLAKLGYDENNLHMASYDWRLSFLNTEVRDKSLSRLKATIELLVKTNNGEKVMVIAHSMGSLYFLYFLSWVEADSPLGGGGGPQWAGDHVKAYVNVGGPFLGVPKAFTGLFSAEAKDVAVAREFAPGNVLDSLQTLQYVMRLSRTWDSTMSMLPKGGERVWGGLDWSPEQDFKCSKLANHSAASGWAGLGRNAAEVAGGVVEPSFTHYGRMVSFGSDSATCASRDLENCLSSDGNGSQTCQAIPPVETPTNPGTNPNRTCGDAWTEYQEMSWEEVAKVAQGRVYTAGTIPNLLRRVAPRMMERSDQNWALGIAGDLSDPKYKHPKYWSNPLTSRLPNAPDMEVYCMYGVGILTERAYVYKMSPYNDTCVIPFRIDYTADQRGKSSCLKDGVFFVDGDETVPALSMGFMCGKGWKGTTRFNPSGSKTFTREFEHLPPASILDGRGTQSGSHVDIMGNFALIEDILKIASGYSGEELGGDRIHSEIESWMKRIDLQL